MLLILLSIAILCSAGWVIIVEAASLLGMMSRDFSPVYIMLPDQPGWLTLTVALVLGVAMILLAVATIRKATRAGKESTEELA